MEGVIVKDTNIHNFQFLGMELRNQTITSIGWQKPAGAPTSQFVKVRYSPSYYILALTDLNATPANAGELEPEVPSENQYKTHADPTQSLCWSSHNQKWQSKNKVEFT